MKILLMALLTLGPVSHLLADMRYNPINNLLYSYPENINQAEYRALLVDCMVIENRLIAMNGGLRPAVITIINQCAFYLNSVGTPAALRLISDLNKNTLHYANGTFIKYIFQ